MAESKTQEEIQQQLNQLKEWFNLETHLPKDIDDKLLKRFLHSCYYNMDKTKSAIELFTSIRATSPELFVDRDPLSPHIQKMLKIVNLGHYRISGNRNIWISQLNDPGLENYDGVSDARTFFLSTDAWLLNEENLEESDIAILDVKDITLKILTKLNMSVSSKLAKYQEEGMPIRLKQIHIVNAPTCIDKIFSLMKPFLHKDITNMIHFHPPKSDTLYQYFKKEELPSDFGGSLESMEELMKKVVDVIVSKREYLQNDNLWKAQKKSKKKSDVSTEVGSFRTLAID